MAEQNAAGPQITWEQILLDAVEHTYKLHSRTYVHGLVCSCTRAVMEAMRADDHGHAVEHAWMGALLLQEGGPSAAASSVQLFDLFMQVMGWVVAGLVKGAQGSTAAQQPNQVAAAWRARTGKALTELLSYCVGSGAGALPTVQAKVRAHAPAHLLTPPAWLHASAPQPLLHACCSSRRRMHCQQCKSCVPTVLLPHFAMRARRHSPRSPARLLRCACATRGGWSAPAGHTP